VGVLAARVAFAARLLEGMPNARAGIATVANWCCSGVSEGGRVTFKRLRDANAERLMDPGARLLGAVVATSGRVSYSCVSREDRLGTGLRSVGPPIEGDLAGGPD
jgi:hypothetical protein